MLYDADFYNRHDGHTDPGECYQKHVDIMTRRLQKGQTKFMPYAGVSECPVRISSIDKFNMTPCDYTATYMGRFCCVKRPNGTRKVLYTRYSICNGVSHLDDCVLHGKGLSKDYTVMDFINNAIDWED
jgi:hypothetical protein